jgi:hypothetical protein
MGVSCNGLQALDMGGRQRMPLARGARGARKVGQNRLFRPSKTKNRLELFDFILHFMTTQVDTMYPCRKVGVIWNSVDVAVAFLNPFLTFGRHGVNVCRIKTTIKCDINVSITPPFLQGYLTTSEAIYCT